MRALIWAPRALTIAFTLFISLFALDSFGPGRSFWQGLGAFAIHLVPSYVLIAMLIVAWRREWVGAVVATALGALFLWWNATVRHNATVAVVMIAGPLFLMAALFLASWLVKTFRSSAS
ncbi:MAG: hypothetical protein ACE15B_15855 [Bryobacteraceae bacterium]